MTQSDSKRIEIFKDGDINFNAVPITVNEKRYGNFDVLLDDLSSRVPLPYGVRNIYTPMGRNRVDEIDDLVDGKQYVATSQRKIKRLEYGTKRNAKKPFIIPRPPSNLRYRSANKEEKLFVKRRQPKMLTVVSNENQDNMTRFVLTPKMENFGMVLQDLSTALRLNGGPVAALVNTEGQKISSCEQLYNSGDTVIAHSRLTMKSDSARSEPDGRRRQSSSKYKKNAYSARVRKSDIEKLLQPKKSARQPERNSSRSNKGKATSRSTDRSLSSSQNGGVKKTARNNGGGGTTSRTNGMTSSRADASEKSSKKQAKKKSEKKKECLWLVTLQTSDIDGAYSDNTAYITLYGEKGKTSEYHLGVPPHTGAYFKGSTNEVEIKVEEVGELYKIRLGHDDDGVSLGWHLQNIILTNLETNDEYLFEVNTWLSRDHGDGEIIKEFAAAQDSAREALKTVTYQVRTYTSDQMDKQCDMDSNIFINIFGERGDTGKRQLINRTQNKTHFKSGQEDVFKIKAISLGPIEKIEMTNDNSGENSALLLEKIKIKEISSFMEYSFTCQKWLKETKPVPSEYYDSDADFGDDDDIGESEEKEKGELNLILYPGDEEDNGDATKESIAIEENEEPHHFDLEDAKKEMFLISTQSGHSVCFHQEKNKFHGKGCSKECCTCVLSNGGDEFTRLVHLMSCDGHLAIDEENVVLTKGNPGLLNEFNVQVNEQNQISFESVVFNGVYLGCDNYGKIAVASENAPERLFTVKCKSGMRDGNTIRFVEPKSEKLIGVNSETSELELIENTKKKKELQAATFIVHKTEGTLRTFRNKQNGKYIVLTEDDIFCCSDSKPSKACSFKVRRQGDGLFVKLEMKDERGKYLCVGNDGELIVESEDENKTNCFHVKIVKVAPSQQKSESKSENEDPICEYPFPDDDEEEKEEENKEEEKEPEDTEDKDSLLGSSGNEDDADDEVLYRDDTFASGGSDTESEDSDDKSGKSDEDENKEEVRADSAKEEESEVSDIGSDKESDEEDDEAKNEDEKEEENIEQNKEEEQEEAKSEVDDLEELSDTEEDKIRKEQESKQQRVNEEPIKSQEESDVENVEEVSDTEEEKIKKEEKENEKEKSLEPKEDFSRPIGPLTRRQTDGHIMKKRSGANKSKGDSLERPSTAKASLKSPSPPASAKQTRTRNFQNRKVSRRHTESQFIQMEENEDENGPKHPKGDSNERPGTAPQKFARHPEEAENTSKRAPSRIQSARKPATPKQLSVAQEETSRPCSSPVRPDRHPAMGRFSPLRSISALQDDSQQRPPSSGRPISVPVDRAEYNPSNTIGEQDIDENDTNRRTPSPTPPRDDQDKEEKDQDKEEGEQDKEEGEQDKEEGEHDKEEGEQAKEGKEQAKEGDEEEKEDEEVDAKLKEFNWKVLVSTGNDDDAGTSSNVSIMLFGSKGQSEYKVLGLPDRKTGMTFQRGKTKVFDIKTQNIGKLKKIRVMHDQSGNEPDWKLRKLTLENKSSQAKDTKFILPCNRWLSEREGDHSTVREIPVDHKKTPVSLYRIHVETGDMENETIDPKLFVDLHGTEGETGERLLNTNGTSFKRNTVSEMLLECVSIGDLKSIILRNAEAGEKALRVRSVTIEKANSKEMKHAECNCWLSDKEGPSQEFNLRNKETKKSKSTASLEEFENSKDETPDQSVDSSDDPKDSKNAKSEKDLNNMDSEPESATKAKNGDQKSDSPEINDYPKKEESSIKKDEEDYAKNDSAKETENESPHKEDSPKKLNNKKEDFPSKKENSTNKKDSPGNNSHEKIPHDKENEPEKKNEKIKDEELKHETNLKEKDTESGKNSDESGKKKNPDKDNQGPEKPKKESNDKINEKDSANQKAFMQESANQKPPVQESANHKPSMQESANQKPSMQESANHKPSMQESANQKPSERESANHKQSEVESANHKPSVQESANQKPSERESANHKPSI
uniref:Uncharacterized protein n=1 Tax=Clytia hemisphaerica TaxID=252671 RepID=A0A7M5XA15_9CNID